MKWRKKSQTGLASARDLAAVVTPLVTSLDAWKQQHLEPTPLPTRLSTISRREGSSSGPRDDSSGASLELPCTLRLGSGHGWRGLDLQLDLLSLRIGCPEPHSISSFAKSGPLQVANRSAGLLLSRLLFPDAVRPLFHALAWSWCAVTVARAAAWGARQVRRRREICGRTISAEGAAARRVRQGLHSVGRLAVTYGHPAALLAMLALAWARVHPSSHQIGRCIAALLPVVAGYGQTARECRLGKYGEGFETEQAWHRRHKWAAQRLAPFLSPLPPTPPLQPLMDAWEALDISIALAVPGGAGVNGWGLGGGGREAPGGLQFNFNMGKKSTDGMREAYQGQRREQQAQQAQQQRAQQGRGPHPMQACTAGIAGTAASGAVAGEKEAVKNSVAGAAAGTGTGGPSTSSNSPHPASTPLPTPCPSSASPSSPHPASELLRFTPEQMAKVQAVQDSARALLDSSADRGGSQGMGQGQGQGLQGAAGWQRGNGGDFLGEAGPSGKQWKQEDSALVSPFVALAVPAPKPWLAGGLADWLGAVDRGAGGFESSRMGSGWESSEQGSDSEGMYCGDLNGTCSPPLRPGAGAIPSQEGGTTAMTLGALANAGASLAVAERARSVDEQEGEEERALEGAGGSGSAGGDGLEGLGLKALYGRADHLIDQHPSLSPWERCQLAARAAQLLCTFAPFLLLSAALLLLAVLRPGRRRGEGQCGGSGGSAGAATSTAAEGAAGASESAAAGAAGAAGGAAGAEVGACSLPVTRALTAQAPTAVAPAAATLTAAAPPLAVTGLEPPEQVFARGGRRLALWLLLWALRRSGAAFIKWGQWASTREDIFPEDLCHMLAELHDSAPQHPFTQTRREIERAFGRPLGEIFEWIDPKPLASGSIAQVHRAVMRVDGQLRHVAVKVRHPGVADRIWQDFQLLRPLAGFTSRVRSLKGLQLKESVAQFSHTMTAQADLRVEAAHLRRFAANFRHTGGAVVIPTPVAGYQSESVLVESFEPGASVARYLRSEHPRNAEVVALGVDAYLQMLLRDNFVHTDLHPGNILVRTTPQDGGREGLQIVLLDFGLAEELTPPVRQHFISFLNMIAKGDGRTAASHLLQWSARQQCPQTEEFTADVEALFRRECDIRREAGIDLDGVMKSVLHLARKHEVTIDSNYAALVVGIVVLVGFAKSLDPRVNLMDAATPCLFYYSLTGRVLGRLYM